MRRRGRRETLSSKCINLLFFSRLSLFSLFSFGISAVSQPELSLQAEIHVSLSLFEAMEDPERVERVVPGRAE